MISLSAVRIYLAVFAVLGSVAPVWAQETGDPSAAARFHIGRVALGPSISLSNIGLDTNVFASAEEPQRDWTATVTPATSATIRLGRTRLTGQGDLTYQYFRKFASERSLSTRGSVRFWRRSTGSICLSA